MVINASVINAAAKCWDPHLAAQHRHSDSLIYIGDEVIVARGRKVPKGTRGKVDGMWENVYSPAGYDDLVMSFNYTVMGFEVKPIQLTNAKVRIVLEDGTKVYTYLYNLDKGNGNKQIRSKKNENL